MLKAIAFSTNELFMAMHLYPDQNFSEPSMVQINRFEAMYKQIPAINTMVAVLLFQNIL